MTSITYAPVARVSKTHGLKGEVVAVPANGLSFILSEGMEIYFVPPKPGVGLCRILQARETPKGQILKIEGFSTIQDAQRVVGCIVLLDETDIPEETEEEDFDAGLIGVHVVDVKHGALGDISEIIQTGANDVWVVDGSYGQVLIPVIDSVILGFTDESRTTIDVELIEGLLPGEDIS